MHSYNSNKKQQGLTLIELLISLALGVIVILGVSQGLLTMSLSGRVQNDNATLQSDADSALSYLSFKMRNALSTPCERLAILNQTKRTDIHTLAGTFGTEQISSDDATVIKNLIEGTGIAITSKATSGSIGNVTSPSTDDITIIAADERLYTSDPINYNSTSVSIDGTFPSARGSNKTLYALTDCGHMDIFRASRSENSAGTKTTLTFTEGTIKRSYPAKSSMVSTLDVSQFIVDDGRLVNKTLFKRSPGPLMDNVELIRVIFGIDNDDDGITDKYITANQLSSVSSHSENVISADIYIMVKIPKKNNEVPENYTLKMPKTSEDISGGDFMQSFEITDKIQRKVFMRSVVFRNNAIVYK